MRTKEINIYQFSELSDEAKEKAMDWYRNGFDFSFSSDCILDDAKEIGNLIGIDIDTIEYSGFCSQGDGCAFTGHYKYKKGGLSAIKEEWPTDELIRIAKELQKLQSKYFYKLECKCYNSSSRYFNQSVDVSEYSFEWNQDCFNEVEDELKELMSDFADWIYRTLEHQYEWEMEDEEVSETIISNEYEFDEEGNRV